MTPGTAVPRANAGPRLTGALLGAGLLTALVDGLFACLLSVAFYQSTVTRLWQGWRARCSALTRLPAAPERCSSAC